MAIEEKVPLLTRIMRKTHTPARVGYTYNTCFIALISQKKKKSNNKMAGDIHRPSPAHQVKERNGDRVINRERTPERTEGHEKCGATRHGGRQELGQPPGHLRGLRRCSAAANPGGRCLSTWAPLPVRGRETAKSQ